MSNMYFMKKFEEEERIKLIHYGNFECLNENEILEDIHDRIVIVFQGSILAKPHDNSEDNNTTNILKPGDHFGEPNTAMDSEHCSKITFCALEDSKILSISIDIYKNIIDNLVNNKLKETIGILKKTPFFKRLSPKEIIPIISNAPILKYKYSEVILQEGQIPDGMYIIMNGQCRICIESIQSRPLKKDPFAKNDPVSLYRFDAEIDYCDDNEKNREALQDLILKKNKIIKMNDQIIYKKVISLSNLFKGSTFGQKILLYLDRKANDVNEMCSMLTIMADSAEVEIMLITRELLTYLSDQERVIFI